MKSKLFVIALIVMMMLGIVAGIGTVYAVDQDERYTSTFGGLGQDFYFGDWHNFSAKQKISSVVDVWFVNNFGPEIEQKVGYEDVFYYFSVADVMSVEGRSVTAKIWAGPKNQGIGVRFEIAPTGTGNRANICFGDVDESWGVTRWIEDITDWLFGIKLKMAFEKHVEGQTENRQYIIDAKFYKYDAITFEETYLGGFPVAAPWIGEAYGVGDNVKFYHSIVADYGDGYATNYAWSAYFSLMNAGCIPDLQYSDCKVNIFDLTTVTGWYDSILGGEGLSKNEWFWETPCWKADTDQTFLIDILDVVTVSGYYGQQW